MASIYSTTNNNAVAGDTTNWTVTITIPANAPQDTYILDIEYDEIAAPVISSIPAIAYQATSVTINGTNLNNASSVTVAGANCAITTNTATQIVCTVAAQTNGSKAVVVATLGGIANSTLTVNNNPAPTVTITAPTASQVLAYGTTSTSLNVTTSKNATCRYGTSNVAYASLTSAFSSTGGTSHSQSITGLTDNGNYTYYVACDSGGGGVSSITSRAFSVSNSPPTVTITAPTASQVLAWGTTSTSLTVTTSKNATCRYGTTNVAYASLPNTFTTTGATSHSQTITVTNGGSYTYYVACDSGGGGTSATSSRAFSVSNTPPGLVTGGTMQGATSTLCSSTAAGTMVNLQDTRDNTWYRVKKMADGRCWMVDNLALNLTASYTGRPAWGTAPVLVSGSTTSVNNVPQLALNNNTANQGQIPNNGSPKASYLYNWCAAMQDTSSTCATTRGYTAGQPAAAQTGICPAPFRLPIGGDASGNADTTTNEFSKLDIAMGGTGLNRSFANTYNSWMGTGATSTNWLGVLSGYRNGDGFSGGLYLQGENGIWWSSMASITGAYNPGLGQYGTSVNPAGSASKNNGYAVRCVL